MKDIQDRIQMVEMRRKYEQVIEETIKSSQATFLDNGLTLEDLAKFRQIWLDELAASYEADEPESFEGATNEEETLTLPSETKQLIQNVEFEDLPEVEIYGVEGLVELQVSEMPDLTQQEHQSLHGDVTKPKKMNREVTEIVSVGINIVELQEVTDDEVDQTETEVYEEDEAVGEVFEEADVIDADAFDETEVTEAEVFDETEVIEAEALDQTGVIEAEAFDETEVIEAEVFDETGVIEAEVFDEKEVTEAEVFDQVNVTPAELFVVDDLELCGMETTEATDKDKDFVISQTDGNNSSSDEDAEWVVSEDDAEWVVSEDDAERVVSEDDDNDLITVAGSIMAKDPSLINEDNKCILEVPQLVTDDHEDSQERDEKSIDSGDDVSDFEDDVWDPDKTDSCYCVMKKLTRTRDTWRMELSDGILQIQGKEYLFTKAIGEVKW